ncbi:unnamed protein product, partial [marine sediment metagenome]
LAHPLTQTGMIMGTPAYMAPEQFLAENTDQNTDQFSFCIALFEALYGHRPFEGDTMRKLAKSVMRGEITLPTKTKVPDHVLTGLLKGLQTDTEDRHDNMDVLIDALTISAEVVPQGKPWIIYITSGAVLVTGLILYWVSSQMLEDRPDHNPRSATPVPVVLKKPELIPVRLAPVIPPVTQGLISEDQMARVLQNHQDDIDDCVAQGFKRDPDLEGTITLDFKVLTSATDPKKGTVDHVDLDDTAMFDKRTARCVLGMSMLWEFPAPACHGAGGITCEAEVSAKIDIKRPKKPPKKRKRKNK